MRILVPWKPVVSCGIAERNDILWFRCVFGASREGPLRARCDHHAATKGNAGGAQAGQQPKRSHKTAPTPISETQDLFLLIACLALSVTALPGLPCPIFSPAFASA